MLVKMSSSLILCAFWWAFHSAERILSADKDVSIHRYLNRLSLSLIQVLTPHSPQK